MKRTNKGFSLIELLIVVAIILILAALAIPRMLQARIAAHEASAVSALRSITNAEIVYKINHGAYAPQLDDLHKEGIIDAELGTSPFQKSGYTFSAEGKTDTFRTDAVPVEPGTTGIRSFCATTPAYINYAPLGGSCDPETSPVI